ncbi:MAG: hypothetical protein KUG81_01855 [Gammaproteobacteria bacterium]|nr:hypothetical protein [Gammaproteobacteria bacterium]
MSIKSIIANNQQAAHIVVLVVELIIINVILSFLALPMIIDLTIFCCYIALSWKYQTEKWVVDKILKDFHL